MQNFFFESKGVFNNFVVEATNEAHAIARAKAVAEKHGATVPVSEPRVIPEDTAITAAYFKDGFFKVHNLG